ncbi:hypothetical protein CBR_g20381 [Chara braunii]|uniref:Uncharacterized protein n=1 Tax=Chara braunii TaxID=69332 RepID=A0A388JU70_CHABU|nr:hypothetical protein CBR_g20381 [Chara braunii]|eukprot:GBG61348.1 hypothetical protein CBR_g20381 [Chara braunii]
MGGREKPGEAAMGRGLSCVTGSTKDMQRVQDYVSYVKSDAFLRPFQPHGLDPYSVERPIRNLFKFRSTSVKMVVYSVDFYSLMSLHVVLLAIFRAQGRCLDSNGEVLRLGNGLPKTTWPRISNEMFLILAPLLVFVLVFYNNQAYNRYIEQFFMARQIESRVRFLTSRLRAFFRRDPFPGADHSMRAILRTLVVAHYCLYFRLPRYSQQKIDKWGLEYLTKCNLITEKERLMLQSKTGPEIMGEALAFSTEMLGQHVRRGDIDTVTYGLFEEDIHRLSYFVMVITSYASNPVPFAYYHLANLLTLGELVLIGYSFIFYDSFFTIVVYALLCTAILGLRDLSCALADPFGVDDTDFPTILPTAKAHAANEAMLDRDSIFGPAVIQDTESKSASGNVEDDGDEDSSLRERRGGGGGRGRDASQEGAQEQDSPREHRDDELLHEESRPRAKPLAFDGVERDHQSQRRDPSLLRQQAREPSDLTPPLPSLSPPFPPPYPLSIPSGSEGATTITID